MKVEHVALRHGSHARVLAQVPPHLARDVFGVLVWVVRACVWIPVGKIYVCLNYKGGGGRHAAAVHPQYVPALSAIRGREDAFACGSLTAYRRVCPDFDSMDATKEVGSIRWTPQKK